MKRPLVSVHMLTYNHEEFITEAINGVLNQECNFDFELVIGEDFSTDKTRELCSNYAKQYSFIRLLPSSRNLGLIENSFRTLDACRGKYIAFCEGDDYWIDSRKLQKQVDFLENNAGYGLIHTGYSKLLQVDGTLIEKLRPQTENGFVFEKIMKGGYICACSVCMERDLFDSMDRSICDGLKTLDFYFWAHASLKSKVFYLDEITTVHRYVFNSISHQNALKDRICFYNSSFRFKIKYLKLLPNPFFKLSIELYWLRFIVLSKKILSSFIFHQNH